MFHKAQFALRTSRWANDRTTHPTSRGVEPREEIVTLIRQSLLHFHRRGTRGWLFICNGEIKMTKPELLSAALIAAAMLATPAMARTSHVTSRRRAEHANASASPTARYIDGRVGIRAPRVSAFPPALPDGENCDVGDNPFIC